MKPKNFEPVFQIQVSEFGSLKWSCFFSRWGIYDFCSDFFQLPRKRWGLMNLLAMWFHLVNPTHRDKQIQPQQHQNLPISQSWQCQWGEKSQCLFSGKIPKIVLKAPMMGIELFPILIAFFFLKKILKLLWPLDFFHTKNWPKSKSWKTLLGFQWFTRKAWDT